MHVFHVKVVGSDGVGNGILGQNCRLFDGVSAIREASSDRIIADEVQTHGVISSGSNSMGLYPNFAVVTAFKP
jgi:hypothetical protein